MPQAMHFWIWGIGYSCRLVRRSVLGKFGRLLETRTTYPEFSRLWKYGRGTNVRETQGTILDYSKSDIQITDCNDGSYCCGPSNTTCCRQGNGKRIASILEAPTSTSSVLTPSSILSITTSSSTPESSLPAENAGAASPTPNKKASSGLSQEGTIGVAVSVSVVGVAIAGALVWYFLLGKRRASSKALAAPAVAELDEVRLAAMSPLAR